MKPMTKVPDLRYEPDWRRLKFVIDQSGMSIRMFAKTIDLFDPDIITHIRYAQCGIDEELAKCIHRAFPQYSVKWLLGQSGARMPEPASMFRKTRTIEDIKEIAYRNAEVEFRELAEHASKLIVRTIPLKEEEREDLLDQIGETIEELHPLYEVLKMCVSPWESSGLQKIRDRYDELCEAAVKFGAILP